MFTPGQRVEFRDGDDWIPGVIIGQDYLPDGDALYATYVITDTACEYHSRVDGDIRPLRHEQIERIIEDYLSLDGDFRVSLKGADRASLYAILDAEIPE